MRIPKEPIRFTTPFLVNAAGAIAAVAIVLYQGWLVTFFQPFFAGREEFARIVFYALYGSLALGATAVFFARADIRRMVVPFGMVGAIALAATALHPVGLVTRAYVISVIVGGATIVLMLAEDSSALLQLAAAVTVLNAVLCLVDLLFADGFSNTIGRAAGLALNPNDAAAGILLGAAASYRAVPRRFQLSFLVLTAGSLAVTLSRSTLLAAGAAVVMPSAVEIWRRGRPWRPSWTRPEGVRPAALVAAGIVASIAVATGTNSYFLPALEATAADSLSFADALDNAYDSVAAAAQDTPPLVSSGSEALASAAAGRPSDSARLAALDARLSDEGRRNSISARALFLNRALLVYRNNGILGMGLEEAQPLAPHNTFVLFGLAFGYPGWFIPLALVGLVLYAARDARDLPLCVAAVGTMATSHDILLMPSLFLPIAIGIGGMISRRPASVAVQRGTRSVAFASVAAVTLFAVGCLVIVLRSPSLVVERLSPAAITGYRGAYLAYFPAQTFPGLFVPAVGADAQDTATFLRDDSQPLTRLPWRSDLSLAIPPGKYAVAGYRVIFAAADGTDPRTNGHVVELGLPHKVGPSVYPLLVTLSVWCAAVILGIGRKGSPRIVTGFGHNIRLRLVDVSDAGFILRLRLSPRGRYLSPVENDLQKQEEWIRRYQLREARREEYYFIVNHKTAGDVGTARVYDIKGRSFCWGSWILKEEAPRESALESAFRVYEWCFFGMNLERAHLVVRKNNHKSIEFNRRFGARITGDDELSVFFEITRDEYVDVRPRLEKRFFARRSTAEEEADGLPARAAEAD